MLRSNSSGEVIDVISNGKGQDEGIDVLLSERSANQRDCGIAWIDGCGADFVDRALAAGGRIHQLKIVKRDCRLIELAPSLIFLMTCSGHMRLHVIGADRGKITIRTIPGARKTIHYLYAMTQIKPNIDSKS
jgi:hypothetical protein